MSGEGNEFKTIIANVFGGTGGVGGIGGVTGGGGGVGEGPTVNFDIQAVGNLTNNFGGIYIIHAGEFREAVGSGNSEFPRRTPLGPEVTNREGEAVVFGTSKFPRLAPLEPEMTNRGFTASHDRNVPLRPRALDIRRTKTVKPPRLRLPGRTSEAEAVWQNQLQPKMIHMLRASSATVSFEETFAAVYKIIHLVGMRRADDSWNLYSQVSAFFAERTAQIYSAAPEDDALVLDYYDSEWDLFSRGIRSINVVFTYFNRTHYWQVHGYEAGQAVWLVALGEWKTNMFDPISPRLRAALGSGTKVADICIKFASADLTLADLPDLRVCALPT